MKHFYTTTISLFFAAVLFVPTFPAHAATTAELLAQIQYLKAQLQSLEQQLLLQNTSASAPQNCFTDIYGTRYCTVQSTPLTTFSTFRNTSDIDRIEVDFVGRMAQVRVEYDDGDDEFFAVEADTMSETARLLEPELRVSASALLRLMDEVNGGRNRRDDDIDDIDVTWRGDDADVRVRFEDGDTDRFTLRNVNRSRTEVIERLADRYDMDEDDIEDVIDFTNGSSGRNDIRSIDVDFFGDDADVVVRFNNGNTERFTLRNVDDDEDEVIERLADRYDMDEDDIEDVIDFN